MISLCKRERREAHRGILYLIHSTKNSPVIHYSSTIPKQPCVLGEGYPKQPCVLGKSGYMQQLHRFELDYLLQWLRREDRKPLLIRGARQVGKSTLVRQLAEKAS